MAVIYPPVLIFKMLLIIENTLDVGGLLRSHSMFDILKIAIFCIVCSYFDDIRHYTPNTLLLCCDDFKDSFSGWKFPG